MRKFLFCNPDPSIKGISLASLILRLWVSASMAPHGIAKIANFAANSSTFPDPLHIGNSISMILAIFAEAVCSVFLIVGFFTRISAAVLLFNMAVIFLIVDADEPYVGIRELPSLYLLIYLTIFLIGGARYSLDNYIGNHYFKKNKS